MEEETKKNEATITLKGQDAGFIIRGDTGNFEMHLPEMKDPDEIVPNHILLLMAIALRLKDPEFCNELATWFDNEVKRENEVVTAEEKKT